VNDFLKRLNVYLDSKLVGSVFDTTPLSFEYSESWLTGQNPTQLANIPLGPGRIDNDYVVAFFDNLLPEGSLREFISMQRHASTTFSLLAAIAGDTAGGVVILPPGEEPGQDGYEVVSWQQLGKLLQGEQGFVAANIKAKDARVSLSGVQDKTLIHIDSTGNPQLPQGTSPSSHILKPNIRRIQEVWESAANETAIMRTAEKCDLPTAKVFYQIDTQACIVERFDRYKLPGENRLRRQIQYDLCQLNGTASEKKYEAEGGPGIARCAELIRKYSTSPGVDLRNFVSWIFFNLYVGNNDCHAKNVSLMACRDSAVRLTPFYDLMCTRIYPNLARKFAYRIGGEDEPGKITTDHVMEMAKQLRLGTNFVLSLAREMSDNIVPALERAVEEVRPTLSKSGAVLAQRLVGEVNGITRGLRKRIFPDSLAAGGAGKKISAKNG